MRKICAMRDILNIKTTFVGRKSSVVQKSVGTSDGAAQSYRWDLNRVTDRFFLIKSKKALFNGRPKFLFKWMKFGKFFHFLIKNYKYYFFIILSYITLYCLKNHFLNQKSRTTTLVYQTLRNREHSFYCYKIRALTAA